MIVYNDKDIKRINNIQDIAKETAEYYKVDIKIIIVDARTDNKESASKIWQKYFSVIMQLIAYLAELWKWNSLQKSCREFCMETLKNGF